MLDESGILDLTIACIADYSYCKSDVKIIPLMPIEASCSIVLVPFDKINVVWRPELDILITLLVVNSVSVKRS